LLLVSWQEPRPGFLIEHSHRLAGYLVGCCVIVLTVSLWKRESRRWLRWLGVIALAGIIVQGLLGGFRVKLDELLGPNLAFIHGSFSQIVSALLVSIACVTAPGWSSNADPNDDPQARRRLWKMALVITVLVYIQVLFGAILRHTHSLSLGSRGHILLAFAIVASVVWLAKEVREHYASERTLVVAATILAGLVGVQIMMGIEAWMLRWQPASPASQVWIKTVHVLLGYLIFATAVVVVLQAFRQTVAAKAPVLQLEGTA
jgi:heme A synthase